MTSSLLFVSARAEHSSHSTWGFPIFGPTPPSDYPGLVVFRLKSQDKPHVLKVCERLLAILKTENVERSLWIVEESRVRIRRIENEES